MVNKLFLIYSSINNNHLNCQCQAYLFYTTLNKFSRKLWNGIRSVTINSICIFEKEKLKVDGVQTGAPHLLDYYGKIKSIIFLCRYFYDCVVEECCHKKESVNFKRPFWCIFKRLVTTFFFFFKLITVYKT